MTDWNWFFSSVSQSIAAVVGIMAGFITTRLVNNQTEFSRRKAKTNELLAECFRLVDETQRRRFAWYNQWENEAAYRRAENSIGFKVEQSTIGLYRKAVFSPFHPINDALQRLQQIIEAQKRNERVGPRYSDETLTDQRPEIDAERERINELLTRCKHQARAVAQHLAEMDSQPESSPVVTFAIVATLLLFFTGVVYPLSFLPMPADVAPDLSFAAFFEIFLSLRGAILTVCASIFTLACLAALRLNLTLKYSATDTADLRRFTSDTSYSSFFATLRNNEAQLSQDFPSAAATESSPR